MAVIDENEIQLNSIRYPIQGKVRPILSAKFAEKLVIGDYTKASNPEVDSWVIQDNRGGILAEEMDEERQADRAWWSTCNLGFLGHMLLPPLPTAIAIPTTQAEPTYDVVDPSLEAWTGDTLNGWTYEESSAGGSLADEQVIVHDLTHSAKVEADDEAASWSYIAQVFTNPTEWIGYALTLTCYAYLTRVAGGSGRMELWRNGVLVANSANATEDAWGDALTLSYTVTAATTSLQIRLYCHGYVGAKTQCYFDLIALTYTAPVAKTHPTAWANFNSELYVAFGKFLYKLNGEGDGWTAVAPLPQGQAVYGYANAITALETTPDGYLMIGVGDTTKFYYMDTGQTDTQNAGESGATFLIQWDGKMFKMDASGNMEYETDVTANPWTDADSSGSLANYASTPKSLFIYRNAAGNPIIYCGTTTGLWAYDFANLKWVETDLALPNHATCGMGTAHWRDKAYISAGLDVLAYQTGGAGTSIVSMGLSNDDGLPQLRGGEIVKFIKGYNEFFALVDSTYEGATSRSTVMAYDGKGWQCWWEAGSDNLNMYDGIVSTKAAHRLWFACGTTHAYYIPLQKNLRNPKKVSTFAYDTAGVHITPWFDANWVGQKLALQLKVFCKDTTADQDVLVEYRIDHATTAIAANGWTTLGTIVAAGDGVETTYTFGSSLGTNFKAIQFKFTLGRITTGTTPEYYSPDIQYAVLEYQKIIKPTWGWAFTIDCTNAYAGRTADQMLDAVVTAAELEVLTPFLYKDTTYYVRVKSVEGERLTGDGRKGTYNVFVLRPI